MSGAKLTQMEHKIIKIGMLSLSYSEEPWCEHWLYGRIIKFDRESWFPETTKEEFYKGLSGILKKQYAKKEWMDRYRFNVKEIKKVINE